MAAERDGLAELSGLVRAWDRPRYYATLFASADLRADLVALYGFAAALARVPDMVSEPGLGEMRLQFWRDGLESLGEGDAATPTLQALAQTVRRFRLPIAPLIALVEAHRADLYSDPPATVAELEGFLGETQSVLFQLAAIILGSAGPETADAAGHAGIAYGLTRRLARFGANRARGRAILPLDLLAAESVGTVDVLAPERPEALHNVIAAAVALARQHLRHAQDRLPEIPRWIQAAFLPLAVVEPLLDRIEAKSVAIFREKAEISDLESLARIAWAAWRPALKPGRGRH